MSIVEECELISWRRLGPRLDAYFCTQLSLQGDRADPALISLQHAVAELRQPHLGHSHVAPAEPKETT